MPRPRSSRPTVGVLVDWLEDVYQNTVLSGVLGAAEEADVNLICFAGGVLGSPDAFGARRNAVYDLANAHTVDALVLMSGTMGNHVGPHQLAAYCGRYAGLPLASIGVPLPGIPSFIVDNAGGMEAAVGHLVDVHGYRRIAFVRGPAVNDEAERRFAVYRQVLAARDIPFDPELVAPGNFQGAAGADAVRLLLDERGQRFDAIVAANDHMALGALHALRARGMRVPGDVAVVGFDDVDDARLAAVPLATVRQPLWMQGRLATESVVKRLRGEADAGGIELRAEFVARRSCGCDAAQAAEGNTSPRRDALFDALMREAGGGEPGTFAGLLETMIGQPTSAGHGPQSWHGDISALRGRVLAQLDGAQARAALDLLDDARIFVGAAAERDQGGQRLRAEHWHRTLRRTGEVIITAFDRRALAETVAAHLPKLGIRSAAIAVFDEPFAITPQMTALMATPATQATGDPPLPTPPAIPQITARQAHLLLAYDEHATAAPIIDGGSFPAAELVPGTWLPSERRFTYIVEPLFFEDMQLGFAVIEMGPRAGFVYEALRSQLGTALEGARLVAQILDETKRREIEERNARQAQKLEAVGRLAAGIAHEINTPVQYVTDSVQFVRDAFADVTELVACFRTVRAALAEHPTWQREASRLVEAEAAADIDYLVEHVPPAVERSLEGLQRVATIVRSMKEFAHPDHAQQAPADINKAIQNTLVIAATEYKYVADIATEMGELPPVVCYLGELNQVFLNIVVNAAHAIGDVVRGSGGKGRITVQTRVDGADLVIAVGDTGGGIPETIRDRIFDPFFTTKEVGKGTGQGLSLAHSVVVGKHGGKLTFETEIGKGTTFFIRIPVDGKRDA